MKNPPHIPKVSQELKLGLQQVEATLRLLDDGATVPFIARYRKEVTQGLDEVAITAIRERVTQLRELDKRREAILKSLTEQNKLTDELKGKVLVAQSMAELEDIYLPFKPKRRTRAIIAKEKGLEPLAQKIMAQADKVNPDEEARAFISPEKGVANTEEALAGARDIIAEWINEDAPARARIRELFFAKGMFYSKVIRGKEEAGEKFKDYFDYQEPVAKAPSHRVLAMRRGEKEEILSLRILPPEADAHEILESIFIKEENPSGEHVRMAIHDSYKRLLSLSIETEVRLASKTKADEEAITVFSTNLEQLLMAPPLGPKNVLAVDPGYRTGCKIVALDRQGQLKKNDTIYLPDTTGQGLQAGETILDFINRFEIEVIAIGNGTASREAERFIRSLKFDKKIPVVMVSESGASIYSASDVARQEFPDHDVTVRGAISIGRRLMDPLAELVKIDPKSIGVGQYQYDVDQKKLKQSLDDVVIHCVNLVGVEINSASEQLLSYVSGLGPALAKSILEYRNENGPFRTRSEFKKVSGLGAKAFEQAAGFLRIRGAKNPLDASAVHPESYGIVDTIVSDLKCSVNDLIKDEALRRKIDLVKYKTDTVGLPTLNDIIKELAKPGRDPRQGFEAFQFEEGIEKPEDLKPGMKLIGIVTNITDFGAFVDVGVHLDGLVHVSQLADRFVKHPTDILKLQQKVDVTVLQVDLARKRISLSMKTNPDIETLPAKSR